MVTHVQALPPNLPRPMQAGQGSWWVLGSREAPTSQPTQRGPRTHSLTPSRCAGPARTSPCGLWDLTCPPPQLCYLPTKMSGGDQLFGGSLCSTRRQRWAPVSSSFLPPEVNVPKVWEHPQFLGGGRGCYYFDPTRLSLNLAKPVW